MMYASWDMDCNRQIFLSFWDIFCSFTPSHSPHLTIKKIEKNKKKRKKSPIDIILLHVCTINEDYMMHGSWDKRCNRQEIFGRFFALLPLPLTIQNMKILKKMEKALRYIIILHMCSKNDDHMIYGSWDMECYRHNFLSVWAIFSLSHLNDMDNQNFEKQPQKKQTHLGI